VGVSWSRDAPNFNFRELFPTSQQHRILHIAIEDKPRRNQSSAVNFHTMVDSKTPVLPPLSQLNQPEPLSSTLSRDKLEDCLPCRVTGAAAFIGLGAYSYFSGHAQLRQQEGKILKSGTILGMRSRQMGITGIAMSLVGLGLYRLIN